MRGDIVLNFVLGNFVQSIKGFAKKIVQFSMKKKTVKT